MTIFPSLKFICNTHFDWIYLWQKYPPLNFVEVNKLRKWNCWRDETNGCNMQIVQKKSRKMMYTVRRWLFYVSNNAIRPTNIF